MACSFSPHHTLPFPASKFPTRRPFYPSSPSLTTCRCSNQRWTWLHDVINRFFKGLDNSSSNSTHHPPPTSFDDEEQEVEKWDWERWRTHFDQVDQHQRLLSLLKSQLGNAVRREDYEEAARIKVAIAAAAVNDTVGGVISRLNRAIAEERYQEAVFLRDNAGAGLVGWWSGLSEDVHDPYGLIIRITAEHGRYVARSYSPRQLATSASGVPLFEIFLTIDRKGEYKQQAVYLKKRGISEDPSMLKTSGTTSRLSPPGPIEDKSDLFVVSTEDTKDGDDSEDDSDISEGSPGFQNILRDMVPGVKVRVLKVTAPAKVDKDFISKVIDQIMDEEDEEKDIELESVETEDEIQIESDEDSDEIEVEASEGIIDDEEHTEISIKVVVGGLPQKLAGNVPAKQPLRVPAKIEKKGRWSFSFTVEKENKEDSIAKEPSSDRKAKHQGPRSVDSVMFDLAKLIGKEKIPLKVLKDVSDLINLTISQAQNRQPLSGSTTFKRIDMSPSPDPLSGLYIGAHGMYTSEVIHLQHKFGQWQDERGAKDLSNLEFYEYVEAVKLTGDPYVPAGQVAFRAKVGKSYQLPHKGIIPEEFGVIARYKGQGKLAEPGFRNPRWVDGELVILDGKYIKGGPVVGFVYWAPEYHFLVFFNRLRLQ